MAVRDIGKERCGIVTFTAEGRSAGEIKDVLAARAINVSVAPPASTLLDSEARNLGEMVRASVHYFNTDQEIERFCATLDEVVRGS